MNRDHYFRNVSSLKKIDIYRLLDLWAIDSHAIGHAVKKLLGAGLRGSKSADQDVAEAIETLQRWQEMRREDSVLPGKLASRTPITPDPGLDDPLSDEPIDMTDHPLYPATTITTQSRQERALFFGALGAGLGMFGDGPAPEPATKPTPEAADGKPHMAMIHGIQVLWDRVPDSGEIIHKWARHTEAKPGQVVVVAVNPAMSRGKLLTFTSDDGTPPTSWCPDAGAIAIDRDRFVLALNQL